MINIICGPNTSGCLFTVNSKCVIYDGPSTTNIGYVPNMNLTDLLLLIDSKFTGASGITYISSTSTVNIIGNGTSANPYKPSVIISPNVGNILTDSNGLYVPSTVTLYTGDGVIPATVSRVVSLGTGASLNFSDLNGGSIVYNESGTTIVAKGSGNTTSTTMRVGSNFMDLIVLDNNTTSTNEVLLRNDRVELRSIFNDGVTFDTVAQRVFPTYIDFTKNSGVFATLSNDGRFSGANAINPTEFVTLQQLNAVPVTNIYTSNGTLSANRIVAGGGKNLTINGVLTFIQNATNMSVSGNSNASFYSPSGTCTVSGFIALNLVGTNALKIEILSNTSDKYISLVQESFIGAGDQYASFNQLIVKTPVYSNDALKTKFLRTTTDGTFELAEPSPQTSTGNWTPTLTGITGYTVNFATYVKNGNIMQVYSKISIPSTAVVGTTGSFVIEGLPLLGKFVPTSIPGTYYVENTGMYLDGATSTNKTVVYAATNLVDNTSITIFINDVTDRHQYTRTEVVPATGTTQLIFTLTYILSDV